MKYEWKKTLFVPKDFEGSGQYIIRENKNKTESPHIMDTGYLSTIMIKIGYSNKKREGCGNYRYFLIDMSDGLVDEGYYITNGEKIITSETIKNWKWVDFSGNTAEEAKQKICDFLNNNPHRETYRKATNEEVIRVVAYQKHRCSQ